MLDPIPSLGCLEWPDPDPESARHHWSTHQEDVGEGVAQTEELKKCHVPNQIIIQEIDRGNAHILCVYSCTVYMFVWFRMGKHMSTVYKIYIYIYIYIYTHLYMCMYVYIWGFFHHKQICYESYFSVLLCVFPSEAVLLVPATQRLRGLPGRFQIKFWRGWGAITWADM